MTPPRLNLTPSQQPSMDLDSPEGLELPLPAKRSAGEANMSSEMDGRLKKMSRPSRQSSSTAELSEGAGASSSTAVSRSPGRVGIDSLAAMLGGAKPGDTPSTGNGTKGLPDMPAEMLLQIHSYLDKPKDSMSMRMLNRRIGGTIEAGVRSNTLLHWDAPGVKTRPGYMMLLDPSKLSEKETPPTQYDAKGMALARPIPLSKLGALEQKMPLHRMGVGIAVIQPEADRAQTLKDWSSAVDALPEKLQTPLLKRMRAKAEQGVEAFQSYALAFALDAGDADSVRALHKGGVNLDVRYGGMTPMALAARSGNKEMIEALHDCGVAVSEPDSAMSRAPIVAAIVNGHAEAIETLHRLGADMTLRDAGGVDLMAAAARSGQPDSIDALVRCGMRADAVHPQTGIDVMMHAALAGQADVIPTLLKHGAKLTGTDSEQRTPLTFAAMNGHVGFIEALVARGVSVDMRADKAGTTALSFAALNGREEAVAKLIELKAAVNQPSDVGMTPIMMAASRGHQNVARLLHKANADVDRADSLGNSSMLLAANNGDAGMVKVLHELGAWLDMPNDEGWTPLSSAVLGGHVEVVKTLHELGANIDEPLFSGSIPLTIAAQQNDLNMVQALLAHGASLEPQAEPSLDSEGRTVDAMYWAQKHGNNAMLLMLHTTDAAPDSMFVPSSENRR